MLFDGSGGGLHGAGAEIARDALQGVGQARGALGIPRGERRADYSTTELLADDSTIIAYKMASAKAGYMYEVTWFTSKALTFAAPLLQSE